MDAPLGEPPGHNHPRLTRHHHPYESATMSDEPTPEPAVETSPADDTEIPASSPVAAAEPDVEVADAVGDAEVPPGEAAVADAR